MLITKSIWVRWNSQSRKHYESLRYVWTKKQDLFEVKIEHAIRVPGLVSVQCDYCGKIVKKKYSDYLEGNRDSVIQKDCCKECTPLKVRETFEYKYGEGIYCSTQLIEVKEKREATNLKKYGVKSMFELKEFQEQSLIKARKSMKKKGTAAASSQQIHIYNLVGGELNYPFGKVSLDIAFPEEMIYIEYDGGGHKLNIIYRNITPEEFEMNERKRKYALSRKGWREIRIISEKDRLPSDGKIIEMICFSKEYLNSGHRYIRFNVEEGTVECSVFKKDYDFGELKKIKKDKNSTISNKLK